MPRMSSQPAPLVASLASTGTRRSPLLLGVGVTLLGLAAYLGWQRWGQDHLRVTGFRVVATYPHDPRAYTQGLVIENGLFHESTGRNGQSSVRTVKLETGEVLRKKDLPEDLFGEGLAQVGDRLIQLTWTAGVARIYDRTTLEPLDQREYEGEGWGLTFDGEHLIQSDGSEVLTFRDPQTFKEVRRVRVLQDGLPLTQINELEMYQGEILANIWKTDSIARIDPKSGRVKGFIDMRGLFDHSVLPDPDSVLNGIAYDAASKRLFVTGKYWPKLFEIELVDP